MGSASRLKRKLIMKKSLLAFAVLGVFASGAFAAPSVTLYGVMDTGLQYNHYNPDLQGKDSTDTFSMESGVTAGNRWGLKGEESIGAAKVGFTLESGFRTDDGTSLQNSRLFGREATIHVKSSHCGTLYAGRMGKLISTAGPLARGGWMSPFGVLWADATVKGATGADWERVDNTLGYASPKFAGFQALAQYSFKADNKDADDGAEGTSHASRFASLGLTYQAGKFQAALLGDYSMWGDAVSEKGVDNGYNIMLGGNYDFGVARVYAMANYFDNLASFLTLKAGGVKALKATGDEVKNGKLVKGNKGFKGWGAELGTKVPAFGGTFLAQVNYRDVEGVEGNDEYKRLAAGLGYTYPFSKRTNAYAGVTYAQEKAEQNGSKPSSTSVFAGLVHKF